MTDQTAERENVLDEESKGAAKNWPSLQPPMPRKSRLFCCGDKYGCCPAWMLCYPCVAFLSFVLGALGLLFGGMIALVVYLLVGVALWVVICYFKSWNWWGNGWVGNIYPKILYIIYQDMLFDWVKAEATPKFMPIDQLKPKGPLCKSDISYALAIQVPCGRECEFRPAGTPLQEWLSENLAKRLPCWDNHTPFGPDEDPVIYVMEKLGSVYPELTQTWTEKQTDNALVRFVLHGIGAHRIETTIENDIKYFVVRTNALSPLPVRDGFARYGGDAFFDMNWKPVKIVDNGLNTVDFVSMESHAVTTCPGDAQWGHAKFRFRSSLAVLVTLVDHLYAIHLQAGNLFLIAMREQLSPDHPMRRFLTPFTFNTVWVNDNARKNLIQPNSMAPRCFAFSDKGLQLAYANAPRLVMSGMEVPPSEGGPFLNRSKYYEYLKNKKGIDTEYTRQADMLYKIFRKFVLDYMDCYYPTAADVAADKELQAMFVQFLHQTEMAVGKLLPDPRTIKDSNIIKEFYADAMASFMWVVSAGHEQTGNIAPYVQDASFCAFKWAPGALVGSKDTALLQALLMSFTSQAMPLLMGSDWTSLFPPVLPSAGEEIAAGSCISPARRMNKDPSAVFKVFQDELQAMSVYCGEYNKNAESRPFPNNHPLVVLDPKELETSISV